MNNVLKIAIHIIVTRITHPISLQGALVKGESMFGEESNISMANDDAAEVVSLLDNRYTSILHENWK